MRGEKMHQKDRCFLFEGKILLSGFLFEGKTPPNNGVYK